MSVREEERNKNCPSRGFGVAAAAIGIGVGAALYYFFNKRPENPADGGATTSGWRCEQPHLLQHEDEQDSYTTLSEHTTSDTSMDTSNSSQEFSPNWGPRSARISWQRNFEQFRSSFTSSNVDSSQSSSDNSDSSEPELSSGDEDEEFEPVSPIVGNIVRRLFDSFGSEMERIESDSDTNMEWDITTSSLDVPSSLPSLRTGNTFGRINELAERLITHGINFIRQRAWTLEDCSICFEKMKKEHEVLVLDCTHRFHQSCIMPWLQEKQTCPICRKPS